MKPIRGHGMSPNSRSDGRPPPSRPNRASSRRAAGENEEVEQPVRRVRDGALPRAIGLGQRRRGMAEPPEDAQDDQPKNRDPDRLVHVDHRPDPVVGPRIDAQRQCRIGEDQDRHQPMKSDRDPRVAARRGCLESERSQNPLLRSGLGRSAPGAMPRVGHDGSTAVEVLVLLPRSRRYASCTMAPRPGSLSRRELEGLTDASLIHAFTVEMGLLAAASQLGLMPAGHPAIGKSLFLSDRFRSHGPHVLQAQRGGSLVPCSTAPSPAKAGPPAPPRSAIEGRAFIDGAYVPALDGATFAKTFADRRQGLRPCRRLRRGRRRPRGQGGARRVRERRLARRRSAAQEEGPAALRRADPRQRRGARAARDARRRQADRQRARRRRPLLRQLHPVLRRARRQALRRGRAGRRRTTSRWCARSRSASSARSCRGTIR